MFSGVVEELAKGDAGHGSRSPNGKGVSSLSRASFPARKRGSRTAARFVRVL
jgi:hypothetical protein